MDDALNATQAALVVGVSERTMRTWLADDKIAGAARVHIRGRPWHWRIPRQSLNKFIVNRAAAAVDRAARAVIPSSADVTGLQHMEREIQWLKAKIERLTPPSRPIVPSRVPTVVADPPRNLSAQKAAVTTTPVKPRASRSTKTRASDSLPQLPSHLVPWRSFAERHGIDRSTVQSAIWSGKLTIVRGGWTCGDDRIIGALDEAGRAQFHELSGAWPSHVLCGDCPHRVAA
jgi:hypothetical protein